MGLLPVQRAIISAAVQKLGKINKSIRKRDTDGGAVVSYLQESSIGISKGGVLVSCNSNFARHLGTTANEMVGKSLGTFICDAILADVSDLSPWSEDVSFRHASGRVVRAMASFMPFVGEDAIYVMIVVDGMFRSCQ